MNVVPISSIRAAALLERHYLGPLTYNPIICLADKDELAVAAYASPIAASFKRALPGSLELARLYKRPNADFETSAFLTATLRWLRARTLAPCVFTYADPSIRDSRNKARRHIGGVYRASGFIFLGLSRTTDVWLKKADGDLFTACNEQAVEPQIVSAAMCYRLFGTKSAKKIASLRPAWQRVPGVAKFLYFFPLRKRANATRRLLKRYAACPVDAPIPVGASAAQPREAAP